MQIHNNTLIAECSTYDFKEMLERKKVKSWLKSVSAFANTDGVSAPVPKQFTLTLKVGF